MFPTNAEVARTSKDLGISLLGNRVYVDQTLTEYLIEFLLIFVSAKDAAGNGKLRFHEKAAMDGGKPEYYVEPRSALRRFIFYNHSKQDSRSKMDDQANNYLWEQMRNSASNGEEDADIVHDLLHSYAIVTRNRGWYAQALLPVAPEIVLPDLQGIKARQRLKDFSLNSEAIDENFSFTQHNFLARGGQMLYLHLWQGMQTLKEKGECVYPVLEKELCHMLDCVGRQVGQLADYVQRMWERDRCKKPAIRPYSIGYIADTFGLRSERFVREVMGFLRCDIHPIARLELLSQGMVLALLRAMHITAEKKLYPDQGEPLWVMDMSGMGGTSNIAKLAAQSYSDAYTSFNSAMAMVYDEGDHEPGSDRYKALQRGRKQSSDVFKNQAKAMQLVIPVRGAHERFTLPESLARYLTLSLIPPKGKVTLDTFLDKLYDHYRIVIAPAQYRRAIAEGCWPYAENMTDSFETNARAFQAFMKQCGFLRDLSDATAIVTNPYGEVHFE